MARAKFQKIPRELPVFLFLLLICSAIAVARPIFLDPLNLRGLGRDLSIAGIMAVGMTYVILTGGIDLSVASVLAVSSGAAALMMLAGHSPLLACIAALAVGSVCGAANGFMVARLNIPPIIVTLGMLNILQAVAVLASKAMWLGPLPDSFSGLGHSLLPLAMLLFFILGGHFALSNTRWGRHIYAVGGNEEAARLAGISVPRIRASVYIVSGLAAAGAGIVMSSINSGIQANDALGYELTAIAAVVIGGTSISGGQGSVPGSIIGAAITIVLRNGLVLLGMEARWSDIIIGVAIFLAVAMDSLRRRG